MLSEKNAIFALKFIIPVFIALLSVSVLVSKIPETKFFTNTVEALDESQTEVMEFTGAIMGTSVAISALPDDFATPLADTLADMDKYFVFILMVIFIERLIVIEGTKIAFLYIIPIACGLYMLSALIKKDFIRVFSVKVAILAISLIMVVPCSIHFTNAVAADYLTYVDETITDTQNGSDIVNNIISSTEESTGLFDKISNAFSTAIHGAPELVNYFKTVLKRCINSIAILLVTSFVMPLVTLWFFKWLLGELFKINIPEMKKSLLKIKSGSVVEVKEE